MMKTAAGICAVSCLLAGIARAQVATLHPTSTTTESAARSSADMANAISDELRSDDPAAATRAVTQIHQLLQSKQQKGNNLVRVAWFKRLLELRRCDDISQLSLLAILAVPADTASVEQIQTARVQAFVSAGKSREALIAAKQLFDVASLKGTADAIRIVCECLNAAHPDDRSILKRYRKEQIDGAQSDSSSASIAPTLLSTVQIDPAPYEPAITAVIAEDYRSLTGEGNLMLLAGRANDAWDVFERAYTMASDKDLPAASENLARCMKAQDGTIGRANAWVLSIRPKAQLAADHSSLTAFAATQASHKE